MKDEHTLYLGRCIIPGAVGDDDCEDSSGTTLKQSMIINGPPSDMRCSICRRLVSELEPFGGPGDPCVGDFSGAKLVKKWREDLPGYISSSWECRDCLIRPGGLWELAEEDRLGRELTTTELRTMRADIENKLDEMHSEGSSQ